MLFKKKLFKKKQMLLKYQFKNLELFSKIYKSLHRNHYYSYILRLSFTLEEKTNYYNNWFKSRQKLTCLYTLGKKVPSKHYFFSRFFLNKKLNGMRISNTSK